MRPANTPPLAIPKLASVKAGETETESNYNREMPSRCSLLVNSNAVMSLYLYVRILLLILK